VVVWLGIINNPNGTVGWGLSRNEWSLRTHTDTNYGLQMQNIMQAPQYHLLEFAYNRGCLPAECLDSLAWLGFQTIAEFRTDGRGPQP